MVYAHHSGTAVDTAGNVLPNAIVEVRLDTTGRPARQLYADRAGTIPLGNPIQANSVGQFAFYVRGGAYYIRVYTGPSQEPTRQFVDRHVAIGTAAERDVEDLADALEAGTASFPTLAELQGFTPAADEGIGGKVTVGTDAGFYHYNPEGVEGERWEFDRPLYDSVARMTVTGGTADAITATIENNIDGASVVLMILTPELTNTGPVTINEIDLLGFDGAPLEAGWLQADVPVQVYEDADGDYRLAFDHRYFLLAAETATARDEAETARDKAEAWADEDEDVPVETGHFSAKHHAIKAENSADASATSAGTATAASGTATAAAGEVAEALEDAEALYGNFAAIEQAKNDAVSAAEASGEVRFFDTYALAEAAVAGVPLPEGQVVRVFVDEENGGAQTFYRVESAALVEKLVDVREYVHPEEFGAAGDGTTDDTTAIMAAFATGRRVLFAKPSYAFNGVAQDISGAHFVSSAAGGTTLMGNGQTPFTLADSVRMEGITFEDFSIVFNNAALTATIPLLSFIDCHFVSCQAMLLSGTGGYNEIHIERCSGSTFSRMWQLDCEVGDRVKDIDNVWDGIPNWDGAAAPPAYTNLTCFVFRWGHGDNREGNALGDFISERSTVQNLVHATGRADGYFLNGGRSARFASLTARKLLPGYNLFISQGYLEYSNEDSAVGGAIYSSALLTDVIALDALDAGVVGVTCNPYCETLNIDAASVIKDASGWGHWGVYDRSERGVVGPSVVGFPIGIHALNARDAVNAEKKFTGKVIETTGGVGIEIISARRGYLVDGAEFSGVTNTWAGPVPDYLAAVVVEARSDGNTVEDQVRNISFRGLVDTQAVSQVAGVILGTAARSSSRLTVDNILARDTNAIDVVLLRGACDSALVKQVRRIGTGGGGEMVAFDAEAKANLIIGPGNFELNAKERSIYASGTQNLGSGATSAAVTGINLLGQRFTLGRKMIKIYPTTSMGSATSFWLSGFTTSGFTINLNAAPGVTVTFAWEVDLEGQTLQVAVV